MKLQDNKGKSKSAQPQGPRPTQAREPRPTQAREPRPTQAQGPRPTQAQGPRPTQAQAPDLPEDLLIGSNPVREALRNGRPISRVWVSREKNDKITIEIINHCRKANIPYTMSEKAYLDQLSRGMPHQGFAALTAPKEYTPWQEMLANAAEAKETPLLILLDGVEDPHNLGAVLRSADAFGVHGVVIPKHRAVQLSSGTARASAGAWEFVPIDRVTNISRTIEEMKEAGLWIIGAAENADRTIYDADWSGPVALVIGGENKGLTSMIRKQCDALVRIPMTGHVNSLNVSVAAAVILSEIKRQWR